MVCKSLFFYRSIDQTINQESKQAEMNTIPQYQQYQQQQQQQQNQERQGDAVEDIDTIRQLAVLKFQCELAIHETQIKIHDLSLRTKHVLNESNLRRAKLRGIAKQGRNPRGRRHRPLRRDEVLAIQHETRLAKQELTAYVYLEACTRRESDSVQEHIVELLRSKQLLEQEQLEALLLLHNNNNNNNNNLKNAGFGDDHLFYNSNSSSEETKKECHGEIDDVVDDEMPFQSLVAGLLMM